MILDDLLNFIEQKRILLSASALKEVFFLSFFFFSHHQGHFLNLLTAL